MGRTAPDRFPELHVTIPQAVHAAVFGEVFGFRLRTPRDRIRIVVVDPRSAHKCLCRMDMGVDETGCRHVPFGIQAGVREGRRQIGRDPDNPSRLDEYVGTNAGRCFHMLQQQLCGHADLHNFILKSLILNYNFLILRP